MWGWGGCLAGVCVQPLPSEPPLSPIQGCCPERPWLWHLPWRSIHQLRQLCFPDGVSLSPLYTLWRCPGWPEPCIACGTPMAGPAAGLRRAWPGSVQGLAVHAAGNTRLPWDLLGAPPPRVQFRAPPKPPLAGAPPPPTRTCQTIRAPLGGPHRLPGPTASLGVGSYFGCCQGSVLHQGAACKSNEYPKQRNVAALRGSSWYPLPAPEWCLS